MKFRRMLVVPVFVVGAFLSPLQNVAVADEPAALPSTSSLDLSLSSHDDWPLSAASLSAPLDLSLGAHDDWPVAGASQTASVDLSLRSHDDWPLHAH
jgi:hypothetical protein